MIKKIIPIVIVGILIISGLGALAIPDKEQKILVKTDSISISEPVFKEKGEYLSVDLKEATSILIDAGKPIIPFVTKTLTFPFGTNIVNLDINSNMSNIKF